MCVNWGIRNKYSDFCTCNVEVTNRLTNYCGTYLVQSHITTPYHKDIRDTNEHVSTYK